MHKTRSLVLDKLCVQNLKLNVSIIFCLICFMNNNFKKELEKKFDLLGTISKKKGPILLKIQTKTYFLAYIGYVRYNSSI